MKEKTSIRHIYNALQTWPGNHEPSPKLDKTMEKLLRHVTNPRMKHDLSEEEIVNLRKINASIEYQSEKKTAETMLSLPNPMQALDNFVYNDYQQLIASEKTIVETHVPHATKTPWLFIGGGPLPMSAILLAKEHGIKSTVIDTSAEATDIASRLITKLEKTNTIEKGSIIAAQGEAEKITTYKDHQVIFIAALTGETKEEKNAIFTQIKKHAPDNGHILARSSYGNRELMYQPISEEVYQNFELIYEHHPQNDVINSIVLFRKS